MPTFYAHIRSDDCYTEDLEGGEYASLEAARSEAVLSAKHILSEALRSGVPLRCALKRTFEITDETGRTVSILPFEEAADIDLRSED